MLVAFMLAAAAPIEQSQWWVCLNKSATRFEKTGERPRDIALAALNVCSDKEREYAEERGFGPQLMIKIHERLVDKLTGRVVEVRAARQTGRR